MLKFHCTHCGGRLAIQPRHLDRLAQCPDCGGLTHPMAEQILARQAQQKKQQKPDCDNCGKTLGKLQKPRRWGKSVVCGSCFRELMSDRVERDQTADEIRAGRQSSATTVMTVGAPRRTRTSTKRLAAPLMRELPAPDEPQTSSAMQFGDLRQMLKTAGVGILVATAAIIVVLYVLKTIGYLLLWSAVAGVALVSVYWLWRTIQSARRRVGLVLAEPHRDGPGAGSAAMQVLRSFFSRA